MSKAKKLRSKKAGLPPGTLIHIGEKKTDSACFGLFDFDQAGHSEKQPVSADEAATVHQSHATLWINVYGAHQATDISPLGERYRLHPLVLEDILNTSQRQKIDSYPDHLYVVLHRYEIDGGTLELTQDQISLVVGRDYVLSFQERTSKTFEPVRQRLRNQPGSLHRGGSGMLAYTLIDAVVDSYFAVIEQINEHAERLESEILGHPGPNSLEGIHQLKRCVSQLRRDLHPLRELLGSLHRDAGDYFSNDVQVYLRDVYDHTIHIIESLEDLRELATGLLDVYLSTVSHRVNLEVRTLTVFTTIFMPATLIAGIFGMNFKEMPWLELPAGYLYALGLMGLIAIGMLIAFWRRKYV